MYRVSDLTPGERLWLVRQRAGKTLRAMARDYELTEWQYAEWEHDRRDGIPNIPVTPRRLTHGEQCAIARRRADLNLRRVAKLAGISHVTVLKYERMDTPTMLWHWWDDTGWPGKYGRTA